MINCNVELDLSWTKDCVLIEHYKNITGVDFQITSTKRYVAVVALSINDNINFLEHLKQEFRRTVFLNKHRSKITTQPQNNNLDYMIDPALRNINRLLAISFGFGDSQQEILLINITCH